MKQVIKIADVKTDWDLKLLYDSLSDKRMKEDMAHIEHEAEAFHEKYHGRKDYLIRIDLVRLALRDYVKVSNLLDANKPLYYLFLLAEVEPENKNIEVILSKYLERTFIAYNKVQFFWYEMGGIPENRQKRFLKSKSLSRYHRIMEGMFYNKHNFSTKEEEIDTLKLMSSYVHWIWLDDEMRRSMVVEHADRIIPLGEVVESIFDFPADQRIELQNKINLVLKENAWIARRVLNSLIGDHKTMDNKRKYTYPFSSTTHSDEIEDKVIKRLININTEAFSVAHSFYELHAKLLGMEKLRLCDTRTQIGEMSFDCSYENIANVTWHAFTAFHPQCGKWQKSFLKNGQVSVFPKIGKLPGAFCMYGGLLPTIIHLNFIPGLNAGITNAHENWHGFHGEWSKRIRISMLRDHSTPLAEAASTFGEKLFCDYVFKLLSPEDQIIALHVMLMNDMDMVFRQTAFFNYEMRLHRLIRKKGSALESQMAGLLVEELQQYFGPVVELHPDDGYIFVYRSHLRTPFYHSAYPLGDSISEYWFSEWKKDKSYSSKIIQALSAGSRTDVATLLKKTTGADIEAKNFFLFKIEKIKARIEQLKALTLAKGK